MVKLFDERAPLTVKAAVLLMSIIAILDFTFQVSGARVIADGSFQARWWPWPQALSLMVSLMIAWLVASLNGIAYWFTILTTGLGVGALLVMSILAALGHTAQASLFTGVVGAWFEYLLLVATFILLVARTSRKAPWGVSSGLSRP